MEEVIIVVIVSLDLIKLRVNEQKEFLCAFFVLYDNITQMIPLIAHQTVPVVAH